MGTKRVKLPVALQVCCGAADAQQEVTVCVVGEVLAERSVVGCVGNPQVRLCPVSSCQPERPSYVF
jgi:hypothetical protein